MQFFLVCEYSVAMLPKLALYFVVYGVFLNGIAK